MPADSSARYVYLFSEIAAVRASVGEDWQAVRALLGGKGANLAEMSSLGIPVPPGFTISTAACRDFLAADARLPGTLWDEVLAAVRAIESATDKRFGDHDNPLLVSCRSGARQSMPGMMDTILNIGLNDEVVAGLARRSGDERFAFDLYRRLVQMFGSVVMGVPDEVFDAVITAQRNRLGVATDAEIDAGHWRLITARFKEIYRTYTGADFPADPYEQLRLATEAVFRSWNGKRAVDYRNAAGIPHDLGTAVNIQTMVFGNMGANSATGVAMSRNVSTGERELEGDFLFNAQGEDVVAGIRAHAAARGARAADAGDLPRFRRHRGAAGNALPQRAGHGVHDRAGQALAAADARCQAHGAGRGAHRRGHGRGGADHARGGAAAACGRSRSTSSCTRSSSPMPCARPS